MKAAMFGGKRVYLMVGFDMETDVGSTSWEYDGVQRGTRSILRILKDAGIPATFLFTGDCAMKNRNILELVHGQGHEIGCHSLYHEDLGEPSFSTSSQGVVLEEELEGRLRRAMAILRKTTRRDPTSFRSPRGFASNRLMQVLEKLGFKVDSSYLQSIHLQRDFPYFVAKQDWRQEGRGRMLELPLFALRLENAPDNDYQKTLDQWPRLRTHGAVFVYENMKPIIEEQLRNHPFAALAFYLHPWEFHPMPKTRKYSEGTLFYDEFLYKNTGDRQVREFKAFVKLCRGDGMRFVNFSAFHEIFARSSRRSPDS
jgi:peptidoglycan/xylan/chitin deacetylase (PgdA/CDA1 family)